MKRILVAAMVTVAACAPGEEQADTMSLAAVDTLKPATDTIGATGAASTATPTRTGTAATQGSTTKAAPRDTTNIGRDRAIQPNTKDPRFRLPAVDTTKRPPD